jgi:hypothetical protein
LLTRAKSLSRLAQVKIKSNAAKVVEEAVKVTSTIEAVSEKATV